MEYQELTPTARARYDGFMDQGSTESTQPVQPQAETAQKVGEIQPGPVSPAGRSLFENAKNGTEGANVPPVAETSPEQFMTQKAQKERGKLTRDELLRISQTVQGMGSAADVLNAAEFVSSAANILVKNIEADVINFGVNKSLLEEFKRNGILERAQQIAAAVASTKARGIDQKDNDSPARLQSIMGHTGTISQLAKAISVYYEKAKISREIDDPFKQIVSFEELMTKFNITLDDERYRPGGEFELLTVKEYTDEFGRQLSEETAHPENFLRWVQDRAEFYHDFDPMANINLFEGMYLVAGSRKVSMYEILVDFGAYFAHRVQTEGELKVLPEDFQRAESEGYFEFAPEYLDKDKAAQAKVIGYYLDKKTKQRTGAYVKNIGEFDEQRRQNVVPVFREVKDERGNVVGEEPVHAVLASKEAWETKKDKGFEEAKEEIMYQVWLLMKNHNMDVQYRQKGMPSEKPLSETLAELYSDNIWTRTRSRLPKMLEMPSTTYRGDVDKDGRPVNEMTLKMRGELKHQGSTGKAFQRAMAAYYHISEGNSPYAGYTLEDDRNPFKELLRREGVEYSDVFYKSILRQCLEKNMEYGEANVEKNPHPNNIASELVGLLNESRVPKPGGGTRARYEWEKAELIDIVVLDKGSFLSEWARKNSAMSRAQLEESFNAVAAKLRQTYAELDEKGKQNPLHNKDKLKQLDDLLTQDTKTKKTNLVKSVKEKLGTSDAKKDGKAEDKFTGGKGFEGLDAYAISVFVRSFAKEYTPGINPYENIRYSLEGRDRVRQAMRDTLVQTEKLDAFDALYAEEWAYTFTYHTGISARNDMGGIGHDAWSKVLNTEFYRLRQSGGGNYPGNLDNLYGIHRLGADFWQGLKVKEDGHNTYDRTLYEELVGLEKRGDTYVFNMDKDVTKFEFAGNAMRQFYADHVSHAVDLFIDITQKQEFNLDKLISHDNFGRLVINNEEMQKMIDSTWKHLRYGFDNNGFLYDNTHFGWLYDEKIGEHGAVSRTPHFGFKTLRELMFSEKVREMNMYDRKDVSSWNSSTGKMARNVFAYLISAQLREHTRYSGLYRVYSAEEVEMITEAFMRYSARVMQGEGGEAIVLSGFFSPEEIMRILVTAHSILWVLYMKEYGVGMSGGFLFGLLEAFALVMKQVGSGIKL